MNKYRFCSGLAISPEHDMKMLSEMSRSGWHLSGLSGIVYKFEKSKPIPYIYSVNFEKSVNDNMISMYRENGWEPVILQYGYQIFRALEGTPPIFSDKQSEIEVWKEMQKTYGLGASISLVLMLAFLLILHFFNVHNILEFLIIVPMMSFIFTFLPFIGTILNIKRIKKSKK